MFSDLYDDVHYKLEKARKPDSSFVKAFGPPEISFFPELDKLKEIFVDEEVIALVDGFMCDPVGLFNSRKVEAFDEQKYDNFTEMLSFLNLQAQTKDIVIYYTYKEGDKYCFRGAFVDKQ